MAQMAQQNLVRETWWCRSAKKQKAFPMQVTVIWLPETWVLYFLYAAQYQ